MTSIEQIRAEVEAAKRIAAERFDLNHGEGAYSRVAAYSASEKNRSALDAICAMRSDPQEAA